jgi:hypothetical protein
MISIQVTSKKDGKPIAGQRAAISYDNFLNGYVSPDVKTDGSGVAQIDVEHRRNAKGKVFVNGRTVREGYIESFMTVAIDYP